MNDLFSLDGKNILITGSAQGIGYLLATGLGKYGAQIIVNDITPERAEAAVAKLQQTLGVALLEVRGRKAFLTEEGQVFLRRAKQLTQQMEELELLAFNIQDRKSVV